MAVDPIRDALQTFKLVQKLQRFFQTRDQRGQPSGYAELNVNGFVDVTRLGTGTPSSSTFLRGDQSWVANAGGDVSGPASVTDGRAVAFDGTTGKLLKQDTRLAADLVAGPASSVDSRLAEFDGTTGKLLKNGGFSATDILISAATAAASMDSTVASTAASDLAAHAAAADPHAPYQKESEKSAANGYASLGSDTLVPFAELPEGPHDERVFRSRCASAGQALVLTDGTAYFVFVGRRMRTTTPKHIKCQIRVAATGVQTAELGLFSSPAAPNNSGQTLTKIEATGTVDSFLGIANTVIRNTNAFSTSVAAGTYLWAGIRTSMTLNEPGLVALTGDMNSGSLLALAAAGALTASGSFAGAKIAATSGGECPDLIVLLDA